MFSVSVEILLPSALFWLASMQLQKPTCLNHVRRNHLDQMICTEYKQQTSDTLLYEGSRNTLSRVVKPTYLIAQNFHFKLLSPLLPQYSYLAKKMQIRLRPYLS